MKTEGGMAWVVLLDCRAGGIPPAYSGCHEFLLGRILKVVASGRVGDTRYLLGTEYPGTRTVDRARWMIRKTD
jgi:hypothetical protein